jgi:hypothetical protein
MEDGLLFVEAMVDKDLGVQTMDEWLGLCEWRTDYFLSKQWLLTRLWVSRGWRGAWPQ